MVLTIGWGCLPNPNITFPLETGDGNLPLFALNEIGYKNIIDLSSSSYLNNDKLSDPHINFS